MIERQNKAREGEWRRERGDKKQNTKDFGTNVAFLVPLLHTCNTSKLISFSQVDALQKEMVHEASALFVDCRTQIAHSDTF